jgi:hypothetical protein
MPDAIPIAAIRHRCRKPLAHTKLALRLAHQQQLGIGGLIASVEIYCDFLAMKRRIFAHGGCGALRLHKAVRLDTDLLCESGTSRYSRRKISTDDELSGLMHKKPAP